MKSTESKDVHHLYQDFSTSFETNFLLRNIKIDHRMKVVSAKFLHSKVTCFPIAIKKCFLERFLETMETSHFSLDF